VELVEEKEPRRPFDPDDADEEMRDAGVGTDDEEDPFKMDQDEEDDDEQPSRFYDICYGEGGLEIKSKGG
jgi:hypothetical protein